MELLEFNSFLIFSLRYILSEINKSSDTFERWCRPFASIDKSCIYQTACVTMLKLYQRMAHK